MKFLGLTVVEWVLVLVIVAIGTAIIVPICRNNAESQPAPTKSSYRTCPLHPGCPGHGIPVS